MEIYTTTLVTVDTRTGRVLQVSVAWADADIGGSFRAPIYKIDWNEEGCGPVKVGDTVANDSPSDAAGKWRVVS